LRRIETDLDWLDSFLWLSTAQTVSAPYYFDVLLQLQILKESRFRPYITGEILERAFSRNPPGLGFETDEMEVVKQKGVGLKVAEQYIGEDELVKPAEVVGLRELAIRMQDASFEARMKLAAASQARLDKKAPHKTTFLGENLTKEELDFYKELFWRREEGGIVTPYLTSKEKYRREVTATLEAILVTNALEKLRGMKDLSEAKRETALSDLLGVVKEKRARRISNWFDRAKDEEGKEDIVSSLATLITRQGYLQDFSFMHAYRYCWGYIWRLDESGRPIELKGVEIGGIYSVSGDIASLYWARKAFNYDRGARIRTPLLPPTEKYARAEIQTKPPQETFKFDPDTHKDWFLKKQWNYLFGNDQEAVSFRRRRGYPDIPEEISKRLKGWAWKWKLPYKAELLGEQKDYFLNLVVFMPPGFDIANFFEAVKIKGEGGEGKETIWQLLKRGTPLSYINWGEIDAQQVDRWLVDMEMGSRFMRLLIDVFDKEKDPIYSLIAQAPSTLGPKEAIKRLYLCFRDDPNAPASIYEIAFVPFLITLVCADKWGITSPEAWETSPIISEEVSKSTYTKVDRFFEEMAYWKRALSWLSGERGEKEKWEDEPGKPKKIWVVEKDFPGAEELPGRKGEYYVPYGKVMTMLVEFYQNTVIRWAKAATEETYGLADKHYSQTKEDYRNRDYDFLRRGRASYKPRPRKLMK